MKMKTYLLLVSQSVREAAAAEVDRPSSVTGLGLLKVCLMFDDNSLLAQSVFVCLPGLPSPAHPAPGQETLYYTLHLMAGPNLLKTRVFAVLSLRPYQHV